MTDINHRRKNRPPVNQRQGRADYRNGYAHPENKDYPQGVEISVNENGQTVHTYHTQRVGKTDYLDKSLHGWGRTSLLADKLVGAGIGNDFCNGHRGMARAVRGAKKFVRTRIRFHENMAVRKMASLNEPEQD